MKKLISILLALILSMSAVALAAESGNATMSITGGDRIYNGYQLLTLTVSLKGEEHHPEGCDGNHTDDCYNYAYSVNEKYRAILQAETFANAGASLWGANKPTDASGVTDAQILEHLSKQSSDSGDTFGTLRSLADRVYMAIKTAGIAPDAAGIQDTASISQGYWMFADVTDLDGEYDANSLVMVDTKGESDITVTPKVAIPTIEKKVKDIEDSEDGTIVDNAWHDSADHDIDGVAIPFKLTAAPPSNAAYYKTYKLVFHDTMSAGLTLDKNSFHVYIYDNKYKADVDTDLNDYVSEVTNYFTITTEGLTDGCTFEVSCENVLAIPGVHADTAFVVYYEAALNENAFIGSAGNPNEVYLEFSNNPYDEGTGETEKDKVTVFTYQLTVNKTDSHGHALAGAGFTLYKKNVAGEYVAIGEELKVDADGEELTVFTWKGLDDGDYKLVETTVPEGYNALADVLFTISATHEENSVDPKLGVELPVYHGISPEVLNIACGHLEGTSLPVGGENTHCILSAHRGLPHAKLFTELDKMELGDTFTVTVLDRTVTYQVDQIKVVRPNEIDDVRIVEGQDHCTLLTCTPYGINSHRLLVRGTRIENAPPVLYVTSDAYRIDSLVATPVVAAPILFVLLIVLMVKYRDKGSKPLISKEEEEWLQEQWQ